MMRENKKYTIKRLVLTVATMIILAGMLRGNTMKVYADVTVDQYGQIWFSGEDAQPGGTADQYADWYANAYGAALRGEAVSPNPVTGQTYNAPVQSTPTAPTTSTTPAQSAAPSPTQTPKTTPTKTPEAPKEKVKVWFTDAVGHVLGSAEITKGTTIGKNQFVKDVPDFDGAKFFAWAYDGKAIEHEVIIRALYKTSDGKYYDPASESWNQYVPK